jgi:hypothetical protein
VRVLGFPVFEVELAEDEAAEFEAYQDAGTTTSTAVAGPSEVPWEDAGSTHQFEAPEDKRRPGFWMGPVPS